MQPDEYNFSDSPEIIENALNHCLNIRSFKCLEFIVKHLEIMKLQPIV